MTSHYSSLKEFCEDQAVNDRLGEKEGIIDVGDIPKKYGNNPRFSWVNWIVKSPTPVVIITWIDYVKLTTSTGYTTPSGKSTVHLYIQSKIRNTTFNHNIYYIFCR